MSIQPLVSVVMPYYNAEEFIFEAIESILNQSYDNIEVLLINDHSSDSSQEIVDRFVRDHNNIRNLLNESNVGLAASINKAIGAAKGEFIARMDADDIMTSDRIEKQVSFLMNHPEIDVVGGSLQYFGQSSFYNAFPTDHDSCMAQLCFSVCFGHPSVMFRTEIFSDPDNLYVESLSQYSEDYDLWCKLSIKYQFANLKDTLVKYRTYPLGVKTEAEALRRRNSRAIREKYLKANFKDYNTEYYELHHRISRYTIDNVNAIKQAKQYLDYLLSLDSDLNDRALRRMVAKVFFELCYTKIYLGRSVHWIYLKSFYWRSYLPSILTYGKFVYKTLVLR